MLDEKYTGNGKAVLLAGGCLDCIWKTGSGSRWKCASCDFKGNSQPPGYFKGFN